MSCISTAEAPLKYNIPSMHIASRYVLQRRLSAQHSLPEIRPEACCPLPAHLRPIARSPELAHHAV